MYIYLYIHIVYEYCGRKRQILTIVAIHVCKTHVIFSHFETFITLVVNISFRVNVLCVCYKNRKFSPIFYNTHRLYIIDIAKLYIFVPSRYAYCKIMCYNMFRPVYIF